MTCKHCSKSIAEYHKLVLECIDKLRTKIRKSPNYDIYDAECYLDEVFKDFIGDEKP